MNKTFLLTALSLFILISGCQKVIDVKLDEGRSQLSVSAFVNSKRDVQIIALSTTAPYFLNAPCPPATGATVTIKDNKGNTYPFIDAGNDGRYQWMPKASDTLARPGFSYTLSINYNNEQYQAISIANPVPPVDSMNYQFTKGGGPDSKEGYYAAFYARDIKGRPDFYWIKSYKNGGLIAPHNINLSIDGAIGGPGGDGLPFIYPVRYSVNPQDGFALGDTCSVEVCTISASTYFFFQEVTQQTSNGGLFATPPANVSTNILNLNTSSPIKAVGFFNVGMVASGGIKIK